MIQFLLWILLLVIISCLLLLAYWNRKSGGGNGNLPPGSFGWPFIGESLAFMRACRQGVPERFVRERMEKYNSPLVVKTSVFGDRMAVMSGAAAHKFLFMNENKLVGAWWPVQVKMLFGKCLLTIRGDEAKWMRKMMLSYLGPESFVGHYTATMDVVTRRHIQNQWEGISISLKLLWSK